MQPRLNVPDKMCKWCQPPVQAIEVCRVSFGQIVRCTQCDLIRFYPPRSTKQLIEIHSTQEYFAHPYFEARRNLSRQQLIGKHQDLLRRLLPGEKQPNRRMLDIGCDTGSLLVTARQEFGVQAFGIEVPGPAAWVARQEHKLNILSSDLLKLGLQADSFDLVTMLDVIEHLPDPEAVLHEIYRLLRPGGRVYIATADHDALINTIGLTLYWLAGQYVRPLLEKLYIPYHEFYFTRTTLADMVQRAHFKVVSHTKQEFPLDEFGHGLGLKLGLIPIFALQGLLGRQTLQELVAVKPG